MHNITSYCHKSVVCHTVKPKGCLTVHNNTISIKSYIIYFFLYIKFPEWRMSLVWSIVQTNELKWHYVVYWSDETTFILLFHTYKATYVLLHNSFVIPDSPVGHRMLLTVASSIRQFVMVWSESPIRVRRGLMLLFKSVEATSAFLCLNRILALC